MECPYCKKPLTMVTNSRSTRKNAQIWRRRRCLNCGEVFTTHEAPDLSHLLVIKKSGKLQRFNRMKLYSGIFYASNASKIENRELVVDKITRNVEKEILFLKRKRIDSMEIGEIVLRILRKRHTQSFLRFLTYYKDIDNDIQLQKELAKFI